MTEFGTVAADSNDPLNPDDTIAAYIKALQTVVARAKGTEHYDAFTITIGANQPPVQLLGLERGRVRSKLIANVDDCYFGKLAILSSPGVNGYPIPRSGGFETFAIGAVFAVFNPTASNTATAAIIGVYVETE